MNALKVFWTWLKGKKTHIVVGVAFTSFAGYVMGYWDWDMEQKFLEILGFSGLAALRMALNDTKKSINETTEEGVHIVQEGQ
jgi:hypothetical protein